MKLYCQVFSAGLGAFLAFSPPLKGEATEVPASPLSGETWEDKDLNKALTIQEQNCLNREQKQPEIFKTCLARRKKRSIPMPSRLIQPNVEVQRLRLENPPPTPADNLPPENQISTLEAIEFSQTYLEHLETQEPASRQITPEPEVLPASEIEITPMAAPPEINSPPAQPAEVLRSEANNLTQPALATQPETPGKFEQLFLSLLQTQPVQSQEDQQPAHSNPVYRKTTPPSGDRSFATVDPVESSQTRIPQPIFSLNQPQAYPSNNDLRLLFPLPVASSITSGYGWRVHPIAGDVRFHSGTDLSAPMGTSVLAAYSGQVAFAGYLNGYGITVVLVHANGKYQTLYAHLAELYVRPGQVIPQGTVIGQVGSTGNSTGPHLHFELQENRDNSWVAVNADNLLQSATATTMATTTATNNIVTSTNPANPVESSQKKIIAVRPLPLRIERPITIGRKLNGSNLVTTNEVDNSPGNNPWQSLTEQFTLALISVGLFKNKRLTPKSPQA